MGELFRFVGGKRLKGFDLHPDMGVERLDDFLPTFALFQMENSNFVCARVNRAHIYRAIIHEG